MNKILYNKTLFTIISVIVLGSLILSTLEYIDLGLLIIPMVLGWFLPGPVKLKGRDKPYLK